MNTRLSSTRSRKTDNLGIIGWIGAIVVVLVLLAAVVSFNGLIVMLILGGLHSSIAWPFSTVGFGGIVLIALALSLLGSFLGFSKRS